MNQLTPLTPMSQRALAWASTEYMPGCPIGEYGCYLTCLTMVASQLYPGITPPQAAERLRAAHAFNGGWLEFPDKIPAVFPDLEWFGARHWRDVPANLDALSVYTPTIIEVAFDPRRPLFPPEGEPANQHFIVAEEVVGCDVRIVDPWDGTTLWITQSRYAAPLGWSAARAITGARLVTARRQP